jgi:hypothetical protein
MVNFNNRIKIGKSYGMGIVDELDSILFRNNNQKSKCTYSYLFTFALLLTIQVGIRSKYQEQIVGGSST